MSSTSLNAQIKATERLILNRQQVVDRRTTMLTRTLYQQMTTPETLLLAAGIGFIVGELSKCRRSTSDKPHTPQTTSLRTLLNLITSARALYAALPIAWLMKSRYQMDTSGQTPEQRFHTVSAGNHRRSRRD
jgi:hypothetical protein